MKIQNSFLHTAAFLNTIHKYRILHQNRILRIVRRSFQMRDLTAIGRKIKLVVGLRADNNNELRNCMAFILLFSMFFLSVLPPDYDYCPRIFRSSRLSANMSEAFYILDGSVVGKPR